MKWIKRLFCKHEIRVTLYGDMMGYTQCCINCGSIRVNAVIVERKFDFQNLGSAMTFELPKPDIKEYPFIHLANNHKFYMKNDKNFDIDYVTVCRHHKIVFHSNSLYKENCQECRGKNDLD